MEYLAKFLIYLDKLLVPLGMGVFIALLTLYGINRQVKWQDKRWRADRKEKAYLECLTQLSWSQRTPVSVPDEGDKGGPEVDCLEKESYLGAMASFQHVPTWLIMVGNFSSNASRDRIQPHREEIIKIFRQLKLTERDIIKYRGKEFIREFGMSDAVKKAFLTVSACSERELQMEEGFLCR